MDRPRRSVVDPARLRALSELGLTERSDPDMERYAERVRDLVGVPVSLVSLVQPDQQVFPGMCGLPDPWASRRSTPLSHSFCQHVVVSGEPLVIEDARAVDLVRDNLATTEIGVVAYAGMPLTDDHGSVLGSLCAIDTRPRRWTDDELAMLRDIARDCSNDLRLRLSRLDAERERRRRDAIDLQLQVAMDRSVRLLSIAESLNTCRTVGDVRRELAGFVHTSTGLVDVILHLTPDGVESFAPEGADSGPSGIRIVPDLHADHAGLAPDAVRRLVVRGARSVGFLPVTGSTGPLAVVELVWDVPRRLEPAEHAMAAALGAYTAQALERALLIEDRTSVAHQLQTAMLSDLPEGTDLDLAACYLPANSGERVGGDWYDVLVMPQDDRPGRDLVLTVGDVMGHDIAAAAVMGQLRSMLRQAVWDRPAAASSMHLAELERACDAFGMNVSGTAVLGRLSPVGAAWTFSWVNAGHPAPLVVSPDGRVRHLAVHDAMFGHLALTGGVRDDHETTIDPGDTLVLYTDGVTDDASHDPDKQVELLAQLVATHRPDGAQAVVDAVARSFHDMADDVVVLVVQAPVVA